jgi:hypothetical protein
VRSPCRLLHTSGAGVPPATAFVAKRSPGAGDRHDRGVAEAEAREIRPEDRERSSGPDDTHLVSCDASTLAASVPWRLEQTIVTLQPRRSVDLVEQVEVAGRGVRFNVIGPVLECI